jgi:type II secretory pathway component GspD/PulD (secretin)
MDVPHSLLAVAAAISLEAVFAVPALAVEISPEAPGVEIETKFIEAVPRAVRSNPALKDWFPMSPRAEVPPVRVFDAWGDLIRTLNSQSGVDLLSAPRVTTRLGQEATIEIIRSLTYATDWAPGEKGKPPVAKDQQTAEVGFRLTILPTKAPDGSIELKVHVKSVDFLGYLDHSRAHPRLVQAPEANVAPWAQPLPAVMHPASDASALQPLFDSIEISTSVTLHDGSMAALACPDSAPEVRRYQPVQRKKVVLISASFVKGAGSQ